MDTPGHADFFNNAMRGAALIDVGVLMVDVVGYAHGLEGGTTKQLISLLRGNEIENLIICINKMDAVDWKEESFLAVKNAFENYFNSDLSIKFTRKYIPMSAYNGENLVSPTTVGWAKDSFFLKELLSIETPYIRNLEKPLRMTVKNMVKSSLNKKKGFVLTVKVESGIVRSHIGEKFIVMPKELILNIKSVFREDDKIEFAKAGDTVDLVVQIAKEEDFEAICRGSIITSPVYPIPLVLKSDNQVQSIDQD